MAYTARRPRENAVARRKDNPDNARKIFVDRVTGDEPLPPNILHVPPRLPDAPVRIDRRPRVSASPQDIDAVRRRWEQELDTCYAAALGAIRSADFLDLDLRDALQQRRGQAVSDLKAVLAGKRQGAEKTRAAAALWDLGDPAGEQFLLDALRSRSAAQRKAALAMLRAWDRRVDLTAADRAGRVLAQLDHPDPEVVEAAVNLCAWKKVPGAEQRIGELLAGGRAANPERVALDLARIATTPETVQALLPHLFRAPPAGYYQGYHFPLSRLLAHPDARIREPIRRALHVYARGLTGKLRHQQHVVHDLAETADAEAIPLLEKIRDRAADPVSRIYALEALARLQPGQAVDLVLEFVARHGRYQMAIDLLREHATEQDAGRVIAAVVPPPERDDPDARWLNSSVVRLLLERLGARGRQVVTERLEDIEPAARMEAVWALRGLTVPMALADLHAADVLPDGPEVMQARVAEPSPDDEEDRPEDRHGPAAVLRALGVAGLVTEFDTEAGMLPYDHDRLILEFAGGTAGRFVPECPVQVWH
jgi:hypothetical protein